MAKICRQCRWHQWHFATGVADTGGAPWLANISANLRKKIETVGMGYSGAGGKLIHKKTRCKKSLDTVPLSQSSEAKYLCSTDLCAGEPVLCIPLCRRTCALYNSLQEYLCSIYLCAGVPVLYIPLCRSTCALYTSVQEYLCSIYLCAGVPVDLGEESGCRHPVQGPRQADGELSEHLPCPWLQRRYIYNTYV